MRHRNLGRTFRFVAAAGAITSLIACADAIAPTAPALADQPSLAGAAGSGGGSLVKSIVGLEPIFDAAFNQSSAIHINDLGQVIGTSNSATSNYLQAAIWEGSTFANAIGPEGAIGSSASGILPDGSVIVGWAGTFAVRWLKLNGVWTSFDLPGQQFGSTSCVAVDIAIDGTIAGTCSFNLGPSRVVLWRNGIMADIGAGTAVAVNRNQQVLVRMPGGEQSAIWDLRTNPMTVTPLGSLGGSNTWANDINDFGDVVGSSQNAASVFRPFLWTARKGIVDLGTLGPGFRGHAAAINNAGQIVGASNVEMFVQRATLWHRGKIHDLGVLSGYETSAANDINSKGQVVGSSSITNNLRATLWTLNLK